MKSIFISLILILSLSTFMSNIQAQEPFSAEDLLQIKACAEPQVSPDGKYIAYIVNVPRAAEEKAGSSYKELYVVEVATKNIRPILTGDVSISSPRWSPDGSQIAFLAKLDSGKYKQVWTVSLSDSLAIQLTDSETDVIFFNWHPSGNQITYIAPSPPTAREKKLKEKGYGFKYFEENLKHRNLYITNPANKQTSQLTKDITIWDFEYNQQGSFIALTASPKNLIDHRYMFRNIYLLDVTSKALTKIVDTYGKLGNYQFSPDGSKIVFNAALERKDHQVSQVFVVNSSGGEAKNLTPADFRGHVNQVGWKDDKTVWYKAGEGVWPTLSQVSVNGGEREIIYNSQNTGLVIDDIHSTNSLGHVTMLGMKPDMPREVYNWDGNSAPERLTNVNLWLQGKELGKQEVITYKARDGWEIEGLLIYPVGFETGRKYPLIVYVHGGPESHYSNGWLSRYSTPGQVMAARGYMVFYPNYRASTGYGVKFALAGYEDPAGKEFDDIADGIDHLINSGLAIKEKVGLAGGSYGGYAAAWFGSYYTEKVKAVCMFVGVSDLISKRGTTDITYEELYVHSGKKLEEMWDLSLKRSPIYYAHQSKTAVLIYGGEDDPRVHPAQSLELYHRLKMNDHPAVRLVQYPGEKHGNSKQPGRIDVLYRQMEWFDWYVMDGKPINGPMPRLDISDKYGLDLSE